MSRQDSKTGSTQVPRTYCTSIKINPTNNLTNYNGRSTGIYSQNGQSKGTNTHNGFLTDSKGSLLVASVKADKIGAGSGTMYASLKGNPTGNSRDAGLKPGDPRINKLVYNMYRGLLNTKHDKANNIVEAAPKQNILTDEGVTERVMSMMKQQEDLKNNKMSSAGGAPPPPPPPFKFPGMVPYQPKAPPSVVSEPAPPTMASIQKAGMPAALAGAMMKDKKPFTYTPGGLNLSEINEESYIHNESTPHNGINVVMTSDAPAIQSKSFQLIQKAYETPRAMDPNFEENPKYTGSNIPSRSFKVLQAMTDSQVSDDWKPENPSETLRSGELAHPPKLNNNGNRFVKPEPQFSSDVSSSISSSLSPFSSPNSFEHDSRVAPGYTTTRDSPVYRAVSPHIKVTNTHRDNKVNSALSFKLSQPTTQNKNEEHNLSSELLQPSLSSNETAYGFNSAESPSRLLSIIEQELDKNKESINHDNHYNCDKITSKNIHNAFPTNKHYLNSIHNEMPSSLKNNLIVQDINPYSPVPSWSSSTDPDDDHQEGIIKTAVAKQSVLKELTSHFDPKTSLKKPKAAPGRVFKYLQDQYDLPEDINCLQKQHNNFLNNNNNQDVSISQTNSYDGSRIPGKTFRMLQENIDIHPSVLQARK